ncbi:MAG: hypothetical protein U9R47_02145 [Actinomycetota bacterium]|nr:hypothetical protein [Actinomycetota bacterium]
MGEKKSWMDKLSETVDKATKAANEAWDGTADLRKDAWDKTKDAANSVSEAFDQGVDQAKRSYQDEGGREPQGVPEERDDEREDSSGADVP